MGGPTTTPKNVKASEPPVAMLAMPGGARRATSAKYTPFQPMAEAPKPTKMAITTACGVSMVKKAEAIAKQQAVQAATAVVKDDVASNAIRPLAHVELQGLTGSYALLLAKPNAAGGVDIVGSLSEVGEAMVSAFILRMAKQRVESAAADKELGRQVQQEHSDMLAGSEEQQLLVVNG